MTRRTVLLVLLVISGLMQLGGGGMMLLTPARAADGFFKVGFTPDLGRVLPVMGALTIGFLLLTTLTFLWILRHRREGYALAMLQGVMLAIVGATMIGTGTAMGGVDAGKGVLLFACGWWALPPGAGAPVREGRR